MMLQELTVEQLISQASEHAGKGKHGNIGDYWPQLAEVFLVLNNKTDTEQFKVACEKIGVGWRTAYHLMRLYKTLKQREIKPPSGIGWKPLVEVAQVLTWRNQEQLFALCREKSIVELRQLIKNYPRD